MTDTKISEACERRGRCRQGDFANCKNARSLAEASKEALPFVAYAYSQGIEGAEEAGRAVESALEATPHHPQPAELAEQQGVDMADALALVDEEILSILNTQEYARSEGNDHLADQYDEIHLPRWANLRAALAAQPSPAGQGAVPCATSASHALRVAYRHLDMVSMRVSHCKDAAIIESAMKDVDTFDLNAAISALAARQPGAQVPNGSEFAVSRTMEDAEAASDGMLPAALVPVADEWYRLCERRFAVDRIRISGKLAEAIVDAVCAAPPAQGIDLGQQRPLIARSLSEWHEDDGNVMWWAWCGQDWAGEPAWCGTPNDSDWPGYHTHWTQHPVQPALIDGQRDAAPGVGQ